MRNVRQNGEVEYNEIIICTCNQNDQWKYEVGPGSGFTDCSHLKNKPVFLNKNVGGALEDIVFQEARELAEKRGKSVRVLKDVRYIIEKE